VHVRDRDGGGGRREVARWRKGEIVVAAVWTDARDDGTGVLLSMGSGMNRMGRGWVSVVRDT
jgi:hypothetical protein